MNVSMPRNSVSVRPVGVTVNRDTVSGVVVPASPDEKSGDQRDRHQDDRRQQRNRYTQYTHGRTEKAVDPEENLGQNFNLQA